MNTLYQNSSINKDPKYNLNKNRKEYSIKLHTDLKRDKFLYMLALPGILFFIIFKFIPIWGVTISFQDYSPFLGFMHSKWVGLDNFMSFFHNEDFFKIFRNTLAISFINLVVFFPLPIIVSLMLNEIENMKFKKIVQTILYIPHFFSWVIIFALTYLLFSQESGIINQLLTALHMSKIDIMTNPKTFWLTLALQNVWKETGWGTIIFLAAIAGVDIQMYEAAKIDGAGRIRQIWSITLPSISNIIVIMLILRLGSIMDTGFEQIFLMNNGVVSDVSNVFDLFSYRLGIQQGQFSFSTAVGLFKSVIGLIMVVITNKIAKRLGQPGVY